MVGTFDSLAENIVACSWEKHFTLIVSLSTQVYKVNAGGRPAMDQHPIQGGVEIPQSLHATETGNKLRYDGPFDAYADFTFTLSFDLTDTYSTRLLVKLSNESLLCNLVFYKPSTSQTIDSSIFALCFLFFCGRLGLQFMCIQTDQFWLLMVEQKWDKDYTLKWCRSVTILTVNQITSTNRVVSVTNLLVQFWLDLATEQVNLGELWLIPKTGETEKARACMDGEGDFDFLTSLRLCLWRSLWLRFQ